MINYIKSYLDIVPLKEGQYLYSESCRHYLLIDKIHNDFSIEGQCFENDGSKKYYRKIPEYEILQENYHLADTPKRCASNH